MLRMGTPFGGFRHRGRNRELPLAEYPEWGLDILRGLYGSDTVDSVLAEQASTPPKWFDDDLGGQNGMRPVGGGQGSALGGRTEIRRVNDPESDRDGSVRSADGAHDDSVPPEILTPMLAEIEAINALLRWLKRTFARH